MKSTVVAVLVAVACSPALASEPTAAPPVAPVAANPVVVKTLSVPAKAKAVAQPVAVQPVVSVPSFCGQAEVYRLLMNTEIGKQLQLRQQGALHPAVTPAVATSSIPAQQSPQPAVPNQQPTQAAPAPSTPANTTTLQR